MRFRLRSRASLRSAFSLPPMANHCSPPFVRASNTRRKLLNPPQNGIARDSLEEILQGQGGRIWRVSLFFWITQRPPEWGVRLEGSTLTERVDFPPLECGKQYFPQLFHQIGWTLESSESASVVFASLTPRMTTLLLFITRKEQIQFTRGDKNRCLEFQIKAAEQLWDGCQYQIGISLWFKWVPLLPVGLRDYKLD